GRTAWLRRRPRAGWHAAAPDRLSCLRRAVRDRHAPGDRPHVGVWHAADGRADIWSADLVGGLLRRAALDQPAAPADLRAGVRGPAPGLRRRHRPALHLAAAAAL